MSPRTPELPRKEPQQARSQALCEAIVTAAARVFDELGYEGTTTNRVAEVAGVSVGSMYQYFPNKDALLTALHERHTAEVADIVRSLLAEHRGSSADVCASHVVRDLLALHRHRPRLQALLHGRMPFLERAPDASPASRDVLERVVEWMNAVSARPRTTTDAYLLLQMTETLIHAATIEPPPFCPTKELEAGITRAIVAFVAG